MKRMIYLFLATISIFCASAQVAPTTAAVPSLATKDHLTTAGELYDAGQWAAAEYELRKVLETIETSGVYSSKSSSRRIEAETLSALCAARLRAPDAGERLAALLAKYPASPYSTEVNFRAGAFYYDSGDHDEALQMFERIDPRRLAKSDRDEYYFKTGHSLFSTGDAEGARAELSQISEDSPYRPHADYYTAYMDYASGNYAAAKQTFLALADHPSYSTLVPYYLLQIEYNEGNYAYVTEHASGLIPETAMPRRAEIAAMAAQSHFRLGNYAQALSLTDSFAAHGGTMTRDENYLVGYSLYMEGHHSEAAEYLSRATGADDALSQNASYHLADIYLRLDDKQRALQSFSIAAASGHNRDITEDALFNYGKLLFETGGGHFNESINVLTRYISEYPRSPRTNEARDYLIAAYYNSRDYEAAYNAIVQHPDPDNNVRAALQKITYFRALEQWQAGAAAAALELLDTSSEYRYNAKYTALTLFWQGEILYSQGSYAAAIPKFEEYMRLSPTTEAENIMARYDLGYANFNLGNWEAARNRFDDFLERHSAADSYRADAFNREGDIEHAEKAYWRAIEKYDAAAALGTPERYYSAYQRALMLGLVERPERKIESLQAIIAANEGPYVEDATYELGRTCISGDRYSDGAKILARFIVDYPRSQFYLPALSNLGLAYLNMGDRGQSMKYYKMIVERSPYSREAQDAMTGIRSLYVDAGDVDGYLAYVKATGVPTDVGEQQRDSLSFAAAERVYLSGDGPRAIPVLENYIAGDARGNYIPTALDYLSGLYSAAGRNADAADAYKRFSSLTHDPSARSRALEGYISSVIATKDDTLILAMADEVSALSGVPEKALRTASFAKAGILRAENRSAEAVEIYRSLAVDPSTPEGAESAFRVIECLYDSGDLRAAEQAVFNLSQSGTPHGYWLGEAFLTLGDIYVRDGDTFQARATYQSIVDGYSPADDGIVAAAKQRIANLK